MTSRNTWYRPPRISPLPDKVAMPADSAACRHHGRRHLIFNGTSVPALPVRVVIRWLCFRRFAVTVVLAGCHSFHGIPYCDPGRDTRPRAGSSRDRWLCFSNPPRLRSCSRQCRNKAYGNPRSPELGLIYDFLLLQQFDPPRLCPSASCDKPENQQDRLDRKTPHARPDDEVLSPDPIVFSLTTDHRPLTIDH
jgi:hypothetical protein